MAIIHTPVLGLTSNPFLLSAVIIVGHWRSQWSAFHPAGSTCKTSGLAICSAMIMDIIHRPSSRRLIRQSSRNTSGTGSSSGHCRIPNVTNLVHLESETPGTSSTVKRGCLSVRILAQWKKKILPAATTNWPGNLNSIQCVTGKSPIAQHPVCCNK